MKGHIPFIQYAQGEHAHEPFKTPDAPLKIGLGHRRLSVLDLSGAGRQPMGSDDGKVLIVYNGEGYNFRQIRG
ncbi:MAG: hypothetical protein C4582_05980, partial [Desulfobacteraceae bacterium]